MNIQLLGSLYPKDRYKEIEARSKFFDAAGNALQWALVDGFISNNINLSIITTPSIKQYKSIIFKSSTFETVTNCKNHCIGFPDINGLKHLLIPHRVYKLLKSETNIIFIYSIQSKLVKAACKFKKKKPNTKIVLMVTDLPQYMSGNKNLIYRALKKYDRITVYNLFKDIDGFVLLSKYMREKLPINSKPYIVIEGIYSFEDSNYEKPKESKFENKTVLYSGTLARRYGIINLVKAFMSIQNESYRLIICGSGDASNDIVNYSKIDNRIIFKGLIDRSEVLRIQSKAALLVNPRPFKGEYVKYSFPSKTIEYLASGTPTLLYKLPGIPNEYYKYCYTIEQPSIELLARKIDEILSKDDQDLKEVGVKARKFILKNKNAQKQTFKIISFINSLTLKTDE